MDDGKYGPLLEQAGAKVVYLRMPRGRLTIRGLWRLWRLLRNLRPEVVQTWMYHADLVGGILARLAGVRHVYWGIHHAVMAPGTLPRTTILVSRLNAKLSHIIPNKIICCAVSAQETHAELGFDTEKMLVIPNGYDFGRFFPNPAARERLRREWRVSDKTFVLGMVGRFDPQKDHDNLLTALVDLRDAGVPFVCVLVGSGMEPHNEFVSSRVSALGLEDNVLLLGQRTDVHDIMNAIDLHVLSSATEAFPNVLAEAMGCGTPCVTTDVGDASHIVGETGWVVPPRDPYALADAIRAAWTEWTSEGTRNSWRARQEAARHRVVERFSLERMAADYRAVWFSGNDTSNDASHP